MKITPKQISTRKVAQGGDPVCAITAYDYPSARLLDEVGVDILLVGDSLGMVVLGYPDTTHVTLDHMLHHIEAVSRGASKALILGDLPYATYETPSQALETAQALMNAGADAVKLEGGTEKEAEIREIISAGIPVIGHLGMLPQSVKEEGGYKKKGKTRAQAEELIESAQCLEKAGCCAIILESVIPKVAAALTDAINIPTIGIGCGETTCDGEVAVITDVVGAYPWFVPPFATQRADVAGEIKRAVSEYKAAVGKEKAFIIKEDEVKYNYDTERNQKRSRSTKGKSAKHAQSFLRESLGRSHRLSHETFERRNDENSALIEWAELNGKILVDQPLFHFKETTTHGEHEVFFNSLDNHWYKLTREGMHGVYVDFSYDMHPPFYAVNHRLRQGTPREYLDRLVLSDSLFGLESQIEGIFLDDGFPRVLIKQIHIEGKESNLYDIKGKMTSLGFSQLRDFSAGKKNSLSFINVEEDIALFDAHGGNFRTDLDGDVHLIDGVIQKVDEYELGYLKTFIE